MTNQERYVREKSTGYLHKVQGSGESGYHTQRVCDGKPSWVNYHDAADEDMSPFPGEPVIFKRKAA